jgi:hypothetical protein
MNKLLLTVALGLARRSAPAAVAQGVLPADHGRSDYQIVISLTASPTEKHAAQELQTSLEQVGGARLPQPSHRQRQVPRQRR